MEPNPSTQGKQSKPVKGWLQKKGGMMKNWHSRWFVLTDKMLFQFNREDDVRAQTSYLLTDSNYRVVEQPFNPDDMDKYCFDLIPGLKMEGTGETVMLCASSAADRQRWIKAFRYALFAEKGGAIFGQALEETMMYNHKHGRKIPVIIEKCVEFLYANGLDVEGIFRLPGRTSLVRDLKEKFDCGESVSFEKLEPDVNSVASLLKLYLRELPESIIPCNLYQRYMNHALRFIDSKNEAAKHQCVLDLAGAMSDLPKDNYTILKYLCNFLHDIGKNSQVNKMTMDNLATVFGPNIIRHMDDNPELFMVTADLTQQLAFMLINHYETVFSFEYRDGGNCPEADLLRMSMMDENPVLAPQPAVMGPAPPSTVDVLATLNLRFADEVFDTLSQRSEQSPESPLCFTDNHFLTDNTENDTQSLDPSLQDVGSVSSNAIARPVPPKRRSKISRGRRISDRWSGSHGDSERVKTPVDDPSKTLTSSIKEALAQKTDSDVLHSNGDSVNSFVNNDISRRTHDTDRVEPSVSHLQAQNEAMKLELVNIKTRYEATVKALQTENKTLKEQYEKRISTMEAMITSQNACLTKEKKDRAEAVERVVNLQAQLHQYQMQYGELRN